MNSSFNLSFSLSSSFTRKTSSDLVNMVRLMFSRLDESCLSSSPPLLWMSTLIPRLPLLTSFVTSLSFIIGLEMLLANRKTRKVDMDKIIVPTIINWVLSERNALKCIFGVYAKN